jgi:hypothetical protein
VFSQLGKRSSAGLQLRRAISIQAEGIRLFEKHSIAPSGFVRLRFSAPSLVIFWRPIKRQGDIELSVYLRLENTSSN